MGVSFLIAALFGAGVLARATSSHSPGRFSLGQVANPNYKQPPIQVKMAKVYHKLRVPIPEGLAKAISRHTATMNFKPNGNGTAVPVPIANDLEYMTPISIGTPPQILPLDVDTGSSDLWVFSDETDATMTDRHTLYSPNASTTAKFQPGWEWWISYGDGSEGSGKVWKDTVSFGNLTFPEQAVEVATSVSSSFQFDWSCSGLLGLGFSNGNQIKPKPQNTFFDNVKPFLEQPVFTADLNHHAPGRYNFGYIDHSAYIGNISYSRVNESNIWWQFDLSGFAIGDGHFHKRTMAAVADTGSTLLMMDKRLVEEYYAQIKGARFSPWAYAWTYPCNDTWHPELPDLVLGTNTSHTELYEPLRIPGALLEYGTNDLKECMGGLQSTPTPGLNVLGDIALKAAFVVHELGSEGGSRIGFANKHVPL